MTSSHMGTPPKIRLGLPRKILPLGKAWLRRSIFDFLTSFIPLVSFSFLFLVSFSLMFSGGGEKDQEHEMGQQTSLYY